MVFSDFFWPDSELEKMEVEYDSATLVFWNDAASCRVIVKCNQLAGLTDLCIWEDMTISESRVDKIKFEDFKNTEDRFLRLIYIAHDGIPYYGGKSLSDGITRLGFKLTNGIWFYIYCQKVDVQVSNGKQYN